DAERIRILGGQSVEVFGNCKFDQAVEGLDVEPAAVRSELGVPADTSVVVVGSIRSEEFEFLAQAVVALSLPSSRAGVGTQWVIAPRHIERTPELVSALRRAGVGSVGLRSKSETGPVLILDTYGELARAYAAADVAVVGGGFAKLGGQNIIQPLALGKPVL